MNRLDQEDINSIKRTDKAYYNVEKGKFMTYEDEQNICYENYINRKGHKDEITKCNVCFWRNINCDRNGKCSKEYPFVKDEHCLLLKIYEELYEKNNTRNINFNS